MSALPTPRRWPWTIATTVVLTASLYLLAMYVLAPGIADGRVPVLSTIASERGYGVDTFRDLAERLAVPFGILLTGCAVVLARARGWVERDAHQLAVSALGLLTVVMTTVFVLNALQGPIVFRGDANDYFLMNVSMSAHGTPELRASDVERYSALRVEEDVIGQSPYDGYFVSPVNGLRYCWHFWLYPAVAAPAHVLLDAAGASPLRAYELTNVFMFLIAMHAIARIARLRPEQRLLFGGLFVASPVAWYMSWPSAEVFTASLVVLAIALFTRERYVAGVLAAALGATINPSLLIMVAVLGLYALIRTPAHERLRTAAGLAGAGALDLAAVAFNLVLFHAGNLIQWAGMASTRFVTPHKIEAFFLSLDQGLLPYVPVILILAVAAVARAAARRDWWVLARFAAILASVALTATTIEWNSDAIGLRRHAMWVFPFLLWLGVEVLATSSRRNRRAIAVGLAAQMLVFSAWVYPPGMAHMSSVTELVLAHAPTLYSPVPSVFAARTEHLTVPMAEALPAVFQTSRGVRKVLVDRAHLEHLDDYLELDATAREYTANPRPTEDGLYYLEFPADSAWLRVQDSAIPAIGFPMETMLGGPSQYGHEFDAFNVLGVSADGVPEAAPLTTYALYVRLTNTGDTPWYPQGALPLGVQITVDGGAGHLDTGDSLPLVRAVLPGEEVAFYAHFVTPEDSGVIRVRASLVQSDGSGGFRVLAEAPDEHRVSVVPAPAPPETAEP